MPGPPPDWRSILVAHAALESGLLAAFGTPATPEDAAARAGLDARATRITARALVGTGHLRAAPGGLFALTDAGAALVEPPAPDEDPAGELFLEVRSIRSHLRLAETLVTGEPVDEVSAGDAETRRRFLRAMRAVAGPRADESAVALGPPRGHGRLLDIGGAPGTYARRFAAAGWDVTVLDLPGTLEIGAAALEAAGIAAVAGDATVAIPPGPWDAVYIGNVAHLLPPDEAAGLLARAGAALAPWGLLAVQEVVGDLAPQGPGFGVMMLLSTSGGDAHDEVDYRGWMAAAGCPLERVVPIEGGAHHLLLGRRVGG
ncbi:MAG: methyltransferase [Thermoleophilia bacterium]